MIARVSRQVGVTLALLVAAVSLLALVAGCGSNTDATDSSTQRQVIERSPPKNTDRKPTAPTVARSHCPSGLSDCRATEGLITFVERVDPDGDGDVHFVVIDSQGITLPGLTAIDVNKELRPHPLPGLGDTISAAGPVQTGSYGQSQIHAIELHVAGQ